MKLWIIAQWGNEEEGADGHDTQCIMRSNNMMDAIKQAEIHFSNRWKNWKDGLADTAILLGDDGQQDDKKSTLIVPIWIAPAYNLGHYPSWHRHLATNEWMDAKTMYGDQ